MLPSGVRSLALLGLALLFAAPARGDEKELTLALQPGFAVASVDGQTLYGGGGSLDLAYGLTDALALRVTGAFTAHHIDKIGDAPAGTFLAYQAGVGLTYTLDILRLVPFFDVAIGLLGSVRPRGGGNEVNNQFGIQLGVGVDYLVTRRFSVGAVVRYHAYLQALSTIPVYIFIGPRISVHFGG